MARLVNMRPDHVAEPQLPAHLNDLRKQNLRPATIRERRLTVLRVGRLIGHPVAEATEAELVAWQDSQSQLSPASMHNAVVHVTGFLKWLSKAKHRLDNPSEVLIRPKHPHRRLPRPMADADITIAIEAAEQPVHAWIGLGAFCGLRCMEMAGLLGENIISEGSPYLRVIGKGGKERAIPLPAALAAELRRDFPRTGYLFTRMDGRAGPPSAMRVSERINDHLHALGIADTAHALRHRFGTKLYEATHDPFLVADVMGHSSTDTTRGYVQLLGDKAAKSIEAISHLAA